MKNYLIKIIIGLFILTSTQLCLGQSEFLRQQQQVLSGSEKCMVQLADSGYLVLSDYYPSGNQDQTFKRLDKFGAVQWYKRATLSGNQESQRVITTSTNKMVSVSNTPLNSTFGILFMDALGNSISHKQFSHSPSFDLYFRADLAESPDQKVYVLGTNHLVKMDSVGNVIWQKRFSGNNMNLMSVHPITSSKLILTGTVLNAQAINSDYDIVQICIDSAGTRLWSKTFGSRTQERPAISFYSSGKIYYVGMIDNYLSDRQGSFIFCTDTVGTQLWCKWIDDEGQYSQAVLLKDGTIACLRILNSTYTIVRFSESGDFISGTKLNPAQIFYVRAITATKDGGLYMEADIGSTSNVYGIKMAANLNPECVPLLPYTPDSMFNQVFDEMPFLCTVSSMTSVSNMNPSWTNLPFTSTPICTPMCNVVAAIKADETQICQGETTSFTNNSQYASSYQWWIGSTLLSTNTLLSHTFSSPGQYRVKLIASNGTCTDSSFTQISVRAPLPQPVFTYQKDHFKGWFNTVVPTFGTATWNFGDGTGMQQHIDSLVHNYKSAGTYEVCLTEMNVCGTVSTCENITFTIDSTFQFIKHYNEDSFYSGPRWAKGAEALYGGGFLLSGTDDSWGNSGWEGTIIKTDKKGNPLWTQIVTHSNGAGMDIQIPHITETHKGYLLLGGTNGASPYLGIMDSSGLTTYMLRLTTNSQFAVSGKPYEKTNGNIIFSGSYGNQAFIAETDLALGVYWFKRHTGIRTLNNTIKIPGGYLMAGTDLTNTQIGLMKVDENGDYVSACQITHSGSTPVAARDIVPTSDGNFIITGNSNGALYLMKIAPDYNVLWTKKYTNSIATLGSGRSVTIDNTGNILVTSTGGVVLKTDPAGNVVWAWDPPGHHVYGSVRHGKTLDGGLVIAGTTLSYFASAEEELSLFRFDNSGSMPSCWGSPVIVTATSITANVSIATDVQTNGTPALTRYYSGNSYASYQAEICASSASTLDAYFTEEINCPGTPTAFSDMSIGTVVAHSWNFQGGIPATSSSINPTVIWSTPGTYSVSLTITGMDGSTSTETHDITIAVAPVANAGNDLVTCAGSPVVLNGSGTGTLYWNPSASISNPSNAVTSTNPLEDELFVLNAVSGSCIVSDTVLVAVNPEFTNTTTATICSGISYSFHGQNYTSSGSYSVPYTTIHGCDSIYTLNLVVNPPLSSTISAFICDGEDYTVGSSVLSATGVYTVSLQNMAGCDSIVTLNLTVILPATTVNAEICSGDSYLIGNSTFSVPGTYTINLLNQNGCDSTVTLNLSELPNSSSTINAEICSGESYQVGSNVFSTSGTYTAVLQSVNGCDSTVTLNLQVLPLSFSLINAVICPGEIYSFNGIDYSVSGTYSAVLTSVNGCDSMVTLNLTVLSVSSSVTNASICPGDTYSFNGTDYSAAGTYSSILPTVNSCDSMAILNLTIYSIPTTNLNAAICSGENYSFNGNTYSVAGTYYQTLQSVTGCDSLIALNLTVYPVSSTILNETICSGESYFFHGNEYSSNGVYSDTLQTMGGCDSVVILDLTVFGPNTGVTVTGTTLTANQTGADYVWIDCDDQAVVGNLQSFTGALNGNYAVVVTWNSCSDTSACYPVTDLGITNMAGTNWFAYPVPSNDLLYLVSPLEAMGEQYILNDEAGRVMLIGIIDSDKTIISLEDYAVGMYQLKVGNEGRIFKIIRQ